MSKSEKKLKVRIINKHATEAEWVKHPSFIPLQGEAIVYDIDTTHNYERLKLGDGVTPINNLPFVSAKDLQIGDIQPPFPCQWFHVINEE